MVVGAAAPHPQFAGWGDAVCVLRVTFLIYFMTSMTLPAGATLNVQYENSPSDAPTSLNTLKLYGTNVPPVETNIYGLTVAMSTVGHSTWNAIDWYGVEELLTNGWFRRQIFGVPRAPLVFNNGSTSIADSIFTFVDLGWRADTKLQCAVYTDSDNGATIHCSDGNRMEYTVVVHPFEAGSPLQSNCEIHYGPAIYSA